MGLGGVEWSVMEGRFHVTRQRSQKLQRGVTLAHVLPGELDSGRGYGIHNAFEVIR